MRNVMILALSVCCLGQAAAVTCDVVHVEDADAITIGYRDLQFVLPLANVDVSGPGNGFKAERVALLKALLEGQEPELLRRDYFGITEQGLSPVHLRVDKEMAAEAILAKGFARFVKGPKASPYDRDLQAAEEAAKEAKLGIWGETSADEPPATDEEPVVAVTPELPGGGRRSSVAKKRAPYAAELNSSYFYETDAPALTDINPQRLIFYASEDEARKAGKRPAPKRQQSGAGGRRDIESARAAFSRGERLYAEAIAAGNTDKRDEIYGQAFTELTTSVQIYSELLEQDQNNEVLGEELRKAMQLRYGAMKQRRW